MADVVRLQFHSLRFSSSLLTSLNSLQPGLSVNQNPFKRAYALSDSSLARFAYRPRKQLLHFKVIITITFSILSYLFDICSNLWGPFCSNVMYCSLLGKLWWIKYPVHYENGRETHLLTLFNSIEISDLYLFILKDWEFDCLWFLWFWWLPVICWLFLLITIIIELYENTFISMVLMVRFL